MNPSVALPLTVALAAPFSQRGVSLVEVLMVIALAAMLLALAMPFMGGIVARRGFEGVANELAIDLRYVRSESVARNAAVSIGFETSANASCYVIHTGAAAACHCLLGAPGVAAPCDVGADEIKTVRLPASGPVQLQSNVPSMSFNPVYGTTAPGGTITVTSTGAGLGAGIGAGGLAIRHVVSLMGRVRSCVPAGPVGSPPAVSILGYRPC